MQSPVAALSDRLRLLQRQLLGTLAAARLDLEQLDGQTLTEIRPRVGMTPVGPGADPAPTAHPGTS